MFPKQRKKNKIENIGMICANPRYNATKRVCVLSYITPPTQMKSPEETKACANPKVIAPSIPKTELLNAPIRYTAACATEE